MTHPLVDNYLQDLDRALLGADPRERADTVAAIREHIDQALTDSSSSADVNRVLQELGSVEMIAAEVTPAEVSSPAAQGVPRDSRVSKAASILLALGIVSLLTSPLFFVSLPFATVTLIWSIIAMRRQRKLAANRTFEGSARLRAALVLSSLAIVISLLALIGLLAFYFNGG